MPMTVVSLSAIPVDASNALMDFRSTLKLDSVRTLKFQAASNADLRVVPFAHQVNIKSFRL